ncbi:YheC/YheD family protein [Paenibacillus psychroresistens]|uniref:YheC/YheD family protein n=1 Tax=Paenibacillus psychroresistens TaxID=1778678 RepID=A0A6B8RL36_9BACL|nr:YheC/YheD family protein [Paenibacillus psychroresistens]QGQ96474.1 YheC/YheD family protein [Paenibacillus psychroresistens]
MANKLARLSKWKMHRFYAKKPAFAKHLPHSASFSSRSLAKFMKKYKNVYIKATHQHTGRGIIKAWKINRGYRFIKVRGRARFSPTIKHLYKKIRKVGGSRSYIIQRTIKLARINGRTFDIRVMMMRNRRRKWKYAGIIAKVSGSGSVVSNVLRGRGYALGLKKALKKSLNWNATKSAKIKKQLIRLSKKIIRYSDKYPFYSYQSGIDLAIDKKGRIWIIEVNLHNPSHGLFKDKDKKAYKRIGHLYSSYRRHNKRVI